MSMLGAQLEDLSGLSQRLTVTSGDINATKTDSTTSTTNVVESVRTAASNALQQIEAQMEALRLTVTTAHNQAQSAVWTGINAETFRNAYAEFDSSMQQAEQATRETFSSFQRSIDTMAGELSDYSTRFAASMGEAETSTCSMATAVEQQRANLDQVMNTGLTAAH
jgi:hypothetical protein